MKIAIVVPGGVDRSGDCKVIPVLLSLLERLSIRDDIHVFALMQEPQPASWDLLGARVHNIGARNTRLRAIGAVCAEHRASRFDVVQSIWSGAPGCVAVAAAKILSLPCLIHVAGGELVALSEIGYGGRLSWKGRIREAAVLRAADRVTAASTPMIESLARLGIAARRIPLGVDLSWWPPREPIRRDLSKPIKLIHVASLNRVKDQPTLLRALAELSASGVKFEMDIVGEDTLQGEVQALARRLGLSSDVRFHGFLPQRQLRPLVQEAHLMVMSSRHEAGPIAVLEAAAQGVATVGTAVGHIAEWAPEAASAVPIGDSAALARGIAAMVDDEELRLCVASAALRRATQEDADYTARRFQALYSSITTGGKVHTDMPDVDAKS